VVERNPIGLPLGERLKRARLGTDRTHTESLLRVSLSSRPDDRALLAGLAQLLQEQGRTDEALAAWHDLARVAPYDFAACYRRASEAHRRGQPLEDAIAGTCPPDATVLQRNVARVIRSPVTSAEGRTPLLHIAICGVSYSGSTLLDRVLGSLPGVRSIGESHWLLKSYHRRRQAPFDFACDDPAHLPSCSICGPSCAVLNLDFRMDLAADPCSWYQKIAERLGTDILVSADKNVAKLLENDPLLRFDALVLFKSPEQAWSSTLDKLPRDRDDGYYERELTLYLKKWVEAYGLLLDAFSPLGRKVFACFDDIALDPEGELRSICQKLGLPFDPAALRRTIPWHAIGGNARVHRKLLADGFSLDIRPLPAPVMPSRHAKIIAGDEAVQAIYGRLRDQIRRRGSRPSPSAVIESVPPAIAGARTPQRFAVEPFYLPLVKEVHLPGLFGEFEDVVGEHVKTLRGSRDPDAAIKADFFDELLGTVDRRKFRELQRRFVSRQWLEGEKNGMDASFVKYVDPVVWFDSKLNLALHLGLFEMKSRRILDIGTGPGHLPRVAAAFGHRATGTELPSRLVENTFSGRLYRALCEVYEVERIPLRIGTLEALPDLGERFTLVTSTLTQFNIDDQGRPWSPRAWTHFLTELDDHVLVPGGRLYMILTRRNAIDESWEYLSAMASESRRGACRLDFRNLSATLRARAPGPRALTAIRSISTS